MIISKSYDVEVLPNFFSIAIIDVKSYLTIFADCVNDKKKPIPLVQKLTVKEIKERLDKVDKIVYYITDTDDSQLLTMLAAVNNMRAYEKDGDIIRTDMFGYNSRRYDKLMIAALLMHATNVNNTKELITKLYETSKRIIELQDNRDVFYKDFYMLSLMRYNLPFVDIDVMSIFALNKVGKGVDKDGNTIYFGKGLKQTSINLQWYELLEYELPPISDKDVHYYNKIPRYKGMSYSQINTLVDKWDRYMISEWINPMCHYNMNDTFILCEIIRLNMDEIRSRYAISNAYNVNVLNSSRSNTADVLFEKFYTEFSGLHPTQWKGRRTERTKMAFRRVIFPFIQFKTKPLQDLLEHMMGVVVTSIGKDAFQEEVTINKLTYTVATGGLHTQDIPRELKSNLIDINSSTGKVLQSIPKDASIWDLITDDSFVYIHWDIASFYPFIMARHKVAPKHLNEDVFVKLITWLAQSRIDAKHTKDTHIDGIAKDVFVLVLKIVINSIYGKLGFERGDLFDRLAVLKVTINGQLMIMMLCEELELNGIEVMSANTDGIVVKLYKKDKSLFETIADRWKKLTKLEADAEEYMSYINRDINTYVVKELNGKMTYKGALHPTMYLTDLQKGYDMPIVAKAVVDYFIDDKPVLETLYEATNILDFCKTQNVGRQYHVGYIPSSSEDDFMSGMNMTSTEDEIENEDGVFEIQRQVRYYVSTNGGVIQKIHNINKSVNRLAAGQKVTICNSLDDTPITLRNINYNYYYEECLKIIDPIKLNISPTTKGDRNKGTKSGKALIKKYSGMYNSLFDDNEFE